MVAFQIRLDEVSFKALQILAGEEYRDPRTQAALIIRRELERLGLLAVENTYGQQNPECPEVSSDAGN